MSINEPTSIGTVVRCHNGEEMLLVKSDVPNPWWHLKFHAWGNWGEIELLDPVVVHQGYTPPTPEPTGEGAVIRTRIGLVMYAIDAPGLSYRVWSYTDGDARLRWSELDQPVEVLFEGVDPSEKFRTNRARHGGARR